MVGQIVFSRSKNETCFWPKTVILVNRQQRVPAAKMVRFRQFHSKTGTYANSTVPTDCCTPV